MKTSVDSQIRRTAVLNPTVLRLGIVSLLADISSEMLYPITPLFLTSVLGASMVSVGFIEGFAEALSSLLKSFAGRWSDGLGKRKAFIGTGYLLAALAKPFIGLASSWTHVFFARALDRTGKGLRTAPRDALLAESVEAKFRGAAFGWHRFMDTCGAVIGPLIAIAYLRRYSDDLRTIFFWAFLPGLASVAVAFTVSEVSAPTIKTKVPTPRFQWSELPPRFRTYLLGWMTFSLANSSDVFLLLRAKQSGLGIISVILLYCLYNATCALLSPYLGGLSDVIGRRKCLIFGLVIFSAVYLGFSFASTAAHFFVLFAVYGAYMAATDGVGKAFAIDLMPSHQKATAVGILGTVTGISTLVASTLAGLLWERVSSQATFLFGSAGALLATVIFFFYVKDRE